MTSTPEDKIRRDLYFSVDIETDGTQGPGLNSMLSLGCVVLSPLTLEPLDRFYAVLERLPGARPTNDTMAWWDGHLDAYKAARENPQPVEAVMKEFVEFVERHILGARVFASPADADKTTWYPVFVANPVGFDYSFVSYYCHEFVGRCPFRYQLDLRSYATALLDQEIAATNRDSYPDAWKPDLPLDHHALNDAIQQAAVFKSMAQWRRQMAFSEPTDAELLIRAAENEKFR